MDISEDDIRRLSNSGIAGNNRDKTIMSRDISDDDIRPLGRKARKIDVPTYGTYNNYISKTENRHNNQERIVESPHRELDNISQEQLDRQRERSRISEEHRRFSEELLKRLSAEEEILYEQPKIHRENEGAQKDIVPQKWLLRIVVLLLILSVANLLILLFAVV